MRIYDTLTHKIQAFKPLHAPKVRMYTCGPTVYWDTHIGHMSKYVGDDILRRVLSLNGYEVTHVMNITDVGHLTSDADEGEDKMEKGAKREGLTVWEIAKKYEKEFFETMGSLNVLKPHIVARATEHIDEQIKLIQTLESKGFSYQTENAVYFDVDKFPNYTKLSRQKLSDKITASRGEVVVDPNKRHPYDFALWFKTTGRFMHHIMHWSSPWGEGFPGWHVECSAMSMKYLGDTIDIHTGGIDHIGVHHPAEIAQSESATGKPFVRYWIHRVFILVDGKKMSKSLGNFYTLDDVIKRGFDSLSLRYLFLIGHYRTPMNFTWQALQGAQTALRNLKRKASLILDNDDSNVNLQEFKKYKSTFLESLNNDLNTSMAIATMWDVVNNAKLNSATKKKLIRYFDEVFALDLENGPVTPDLIELAPEIKRLLGEREHFRKKGEYEQADKIRSIIEKLGYSVNDRQNGAQINTKS